MYDEFSIVTPIYSEYYNEIGNINIINNAEQMENFLEIFRFEFTLVQDKSVSVLFICQNEIDILNSVKLLLKICIIRPL